MTEQDRLIAGRYRLTERVGSGAMGVVWRARDERLERIVAVKQLLLQPGLSAERAEEARQRAMREARIAARLQHVNVVIVYDVAEHEGQPWLIMEYVPSRSLATALRDGPLGPHQVISIGAQAAAGLAAAHAAGVVHRDVKPGNVLLGDDGIVKIADFGISRAVDDVVLTATGLLSGTPAYLAPEVAKGASPASPSDVFALGATLYAAVEGTPPFGLADNPLALLHLVAGGRVRPPTKAGPLTPVLLNLLRADPAARPTMRDAHAQLAALAAAPVRAPTKPPVQPMPMAPPAATMVSVPRPRRKPVLLALAIVVVALAVGGALVALNRHGHRSVASSPPAVQPAATGQPTTVAPTEDDGAPGFAAMVGLVRQYYNLLPGDVDDAYRLLSGAYRLAHPLPAVRLFYVGIQRVTPSQFESAGPNKISAVITFVTRRGVTTHEPYRFTITRRHGDLIIDNAVQLAAPGA
ncbi:MAG TPA: protein kinase [Pseudonocardiaceae bacterium]|nr:protein kinase [Pseudonocardiaceae bacterium]